MNRRTAITMASLATLCLGVALPTNFAIAQQKDQLTGSWSLVSATIEQGGKKSDFYGHHICAAAPFDVVTRELSSDFGKRRVGFGHSMLNMPLVSRTGEASVNKPIRFVAPE